MSKAPEKLSPDEISLLFAQLSPQDVAEFYNGYQQWLRQHQIANLQTHIARVRLQVAENNRQMQQVHPSPIALASLARLQSNGVTDFDLLDRMLERGEAWLDNTMQHLDYCEKFDFIRGNYTEWCEHALEGAYDWIDSMHKVSIEAAKSAPQPTTQSSTMESANNDSSEMLNEATEATFLQKLMSEEDVSLLDTKLEIPSISPSTSDTIPNVPTQIITPQPHTADIPTQIIAPHPHAADVGARFIAPQSHAELENTIPTADISHSTAQDQATPSIQPYATPALAVNAPLKQHLEAVDPTPVLVEETSAIATESNVASTPTSAQEVSTLTPEEPVDSTPLPVNETSTTFAEHIPAAPAFTAIHPSNTATPTDTTTAPGTSSPSAEPATTSAHIELQPSTPEITTTPDEHHLDSTPSTPENTTEQNTTTDGPLSPSLASEHPIAQHTPTDVGARFIPPQPHAGEASPQVSTLLPENIPSAHPAPEPAPGHPDFIPKTATHTTPNAENTPGSTQAATEQIASSAQTPIVNEATIVPPPAEEITQPSLPAQTHKQEVSDAPTIPEFPTTTVPQPQEKTTEPAASTVSAEPNNTTNDTPWRWEDPLPSEINTSSGKPQENTQQASAPLPTAQPPKKRNFFQRLFRKSPRN